MESGEGAMDDQYGSSCPKKRGREVGRAGSHSTGGNGSRAVGRQTRKVSAKRKGEEKGEEERQERKEGQEGREIRREKEEAGERLLEGSWKEGSGSSLWPDWPGPRPGDQGKDAEERKEVDQQEEEREEEEIQKGRQQWNLPVWEWERDKQYERGVGSGWTSLRGDHYGQEVVQGGPWSPDGKLDEGMPRVPHDSSGFELGHSGGRGPSIGHPVLQDANSTQDGSCYVPRVPNIGGNSGPMLARKSRRGDGLPGAEDEGPFVHGRRSSLHSGSEIRTPTWGENKSGIVGGDTGCSFSSPEGGSGLQQGQVHPPELGKPIPAIGPKQGTRQRRKGKERQGQEQRARQGRRDQRGRQPKEKLKRRGEVRVRKEVLKRKIGGREAPKIRREDRVQKGKHVGEQDSCRKMAMMARPISDEAVNPGGAGEAAVQKHQPAAGVTLLRERVMDIVSHNLVLDTSLGSLSSVLLQCLYECCKPLSMAGDDQVDSNQQLSCADTAADGVHWAQWEKTILLALSLLAGDADPLRSDFLRDAWWKKNIRAQMERFDIWEERVDIGSFQDFFTHRNVDYSGDEIKLALDLSWNAVEKSLPKGVGQLDLLDFCSLGTRAYVQNFEDFLVPPEMQVRLKHPRVMVVEGGWDELCAGLLEREICSVFPLQEVFAVEGQPVLSGLFAVGKGEFESNVETQRLIMNLTPINANCREMKGDISTLPSLANMGLMVMGPNQQCLVSSEDIRCFFYLFRTPQSWRRYMCFNRKVPVHLVPEKWKHLDCVLSSNVLPMGFCNSVSIAQHVHRLVVNQSTKMMKTPVLGEGEIRRDKGFPRKDDRYRTYLDNFDQLEVWDKTMAEKLKGTVSDQVEALRAKYDELKLPRHPKKAVSRSLRAEVQGALLLGDKGIAIAKPQKLVQYLGLTLALLKLGECKLRELQVVVGGLVYLSTFRRPLLSGLNEVWRFMENLKTFPPVVKLPLPEKVVLELVRFLCLLPLAQISFTASVQGLVTCSDASMEGGGICRSLGLTSYGLIASDAPVRGDIPEEHDFVQVLSIGLFDGLSGLRVACDALGLPMAGHVSVESNGEAKRVVESFFPETVFHDDVTTVDAEMVLGWSLKFSSAGVVLLGAGPPCQGVSGLNSDRRGALRDSRSVLFKEVSRIRGLVQKFFFWAQVHLLMESVASMTEEDKGIMSASVDLEPWKVEALGLTLCRRPRLYWISWELAANEGVWLWDDHGQRAVSFEFLAESKALLEPGWQLAGDCLPTFTTSRPSPIPGRKPAGLQNLSSSERHLWVKDRHRFPPYQYAFKAGVVNKAGEWRLYPPWSSARSIWDFLFNIPRPVK